VDYAKGICIVMVVMMHSVLGVEAAAGQTGFMHLLVAFFVYFYSGFLLAGYVFALSDRARARPALALAGLAFWALINSSLVVSGCSERPLISLALTDSIHQSPGTKHLRGA
jgi:uncharacterized membrane protein YcfT